MKEEREEGRKGRDRSCKVRGDVFVYIKFRMYKDELMVLINEIKGKERHGMACSLKTMCGYISIPRTRV